MDVAARHSFNRLSIRVLLVLGLAAASDAARSATFVVTSTSPGLSGSCTASSCGASCRLYDALCADVNTPGANTVVLQPNASYAVSTCPSNVTGCVAQTAFPEVKKQLTVVGNGATITASGARFFSVNANGVLRIENTRLAGGSASGGGAIFSTGHLLVFNSTFQNNSSSNVGRGGAIWNRFGVLYVEGSTFVGNSATQDGGAISSHGSFALPATLTIKNSSLIKNVALGDPSFNALGDGGAIELLCQNFAAVENTTLSQNIAAGRGGAILVGSMPSDVTGSFVKLTNVTVTTNRSTAGGGGLFTSTSRPATVCGNATCDPPILVNLTKTIVANNADPSSPDWSGSGLLIGTAYSSGGDNLIGNPVGGAFVTPVNSDLTGVSLLGPLVTTGDAGGLHHRLQLGSPALDSSPCGLPTDQLGLLRPDMPLSQCDRGAIESRNCVAPPSRMAAWWTFDETAGGLAHDGAGFPNVGTWQNAPTSVPGMVDGALSFNGLNQAVTVPNQAELDFIGSCSTGSTLDFSIDAWVKTSRSDLQVVLDKRTALPLTGYSLFIYGGRLGFQMASMGTVNNFLAPAATLNDGRWHHVAVTVKRCGPLVGKLYVDGSAVHTFTPLLGGLGNSSGLLIGRRNPLFGQRYFSGAIDELENRQARAEPCRSGGLGARRLGGEVQVRWHAVSLLSATGTGRPHFQTRAMLSRFDRRLGRARPHAA